MCQIIVLKIPYQENGKLDYIYPVVLKDDRELVLVDCGSANSLPEIDLAMKAKNLQAGEITKVIITHHDYDHVGGLAALKDKYPNVQIVASKIESQFIDGSAKSQRLTQAEEYQYQLSEELKSKGMAFCKMLKNIKPTPIDIIVRDGQILDFCGGCQIIATPGHTAGHISLFLKYNNTIISGDAAVFTEGELVVANPEFAIDYTKAKHSLQKIKDYKADTIICYHGGVYKRKKDILANNLDTKLNE